MKIPDPRYQNCGYHAWFAFFALAFICFPLLLSVVSEGLTADLPVRGKPAIWFMVGLLAFGSIYLLKEFILQFRCWLKKSANRKSH
ncbi:MAG: hypothetical protein MUF13_00440 [Akkermansiaceae bacterium]|jgi:hypothetical protein|nr:hypothetical protein [Akkermansiaceae bacterium]